MAATFANGGINPINSERVISSTVADDTLGITAACGMYETSGQWLFRVGMPAKSGVGGGIMAILPGQLAIATYSPRLDHAGHSVRGVAAIKRLSDQFGLHFLSVARAARSVMRGSLDLRTARSRKQRTPEQGEWLEAHGGQYQVLLLQGDLSFAAVERVLREIGNPSRWSGVVIDLKHVSRVNMAALSLLMGLAVDTHILLTTTGQGFDAAFETYADRVLPLERRTWLQTFSHLDDALDWAEEDLLSTMIRRDRTESEETHNSDHGGIRPQHHPMLRSLSPEQREAVLAISKVKVMEKGEALARCGEEAKAVYLVLDGYVDVSIPASADVANSKQADGDDDADRAPTRRARRKNSTSVPLFGFRAQSMAMLLKVKNKFMKLRSRRVASIGEGGAVGELAVLGDSPYSSVDAVAATTTVRCLVVPVGPKLRALFDEYPKVEVHFLKFILQRATTTITRLNRELRVLAS